jgi:hypothetical protein
MSLLREGGHDKTIVDRRMLMELKVCAACGRRFHLGEPVVRAAGRDGTPLGWIHEEEAKYDPRTGGYQEVTHADP